MKQSSSSLFALIKYAKSFAWCAAKLIGVMIEIEG
jgi:hypothetical protein